MAVLSIGIGIALSLKKQTPLNASSQENVIILDNLDCVKKSYPNFWEVFLLLGGKIYEYLG